MTKFYNSKGKYKTRSGNIKTKECQLWENIRNRSEYLSNYDEKRFGKYAETRSCQDWLDFQNFAAWFEDVKSLGYYEKGWQLDKDLLVKGNKVYAPEFCVFLPEEVNKALNTKSRTRGDLPLGLSYAGDSKSKKYIEARFDCKYPEFSFRTCFPSNKENIKIGFDLYKAAKEKYVRFLAEKYKRSLDPRAYQSLASYEVDIND